MDYNVYQFLWFFVLYSFAGWWAGVAVAAARKKAFINTGFLNAPLCPVYGVGAVAFTVFLPELRERLFFLFLGGMILSAFLTLTTGLLLERIFHRRWWDFSKNRFQFEGYLSLPCAAACGAAAVLCVRVTNPLLAELVELVPHWIGRIILIAVYLLLAIDFSCSLAAVWQLRYRVKRFAIISENLQRVTDSFGHAITGRIQRRVMRAYPNLEKEKLLEAEQRLERDRLEKLEGTAAGKREVFAEGCCFYKLVGLFFLGAFLGDVTETIFCYLTAGVWMSRSSVVYGPFSIVWGLGCMMLTALLYKYKDRSDRYIFICGTVLGGAYEYICSVFTELVFGTIFWDYSKIPFNLGGRINLLFCFFWGIAAVVWLKGIYPGLSGLIERIPKKIGVPGAWILLVFMAVNMSVSGLALARYSARQAGAGPAEREVGIWLDERFPDSRIEHIYPNMKIVP